MDILSQTGAIHAQMAAVLAQIPKPASAHQKLAAKAAIARAKAALDPVVMDAVRNSPWPATWTSDLPQSGKRWRVRNAHANLCIDVPFDPNGAAAALGTLIGLADLASQADGPGLVMEGQRMGLVPGPRAYLFEGDALVPGRTGRGISAGDALARDRAARVEPLQHAKPTGWGMVPESSESVFARTLKHYAQFHRFVATASLIPTLWERVMAHPVLRKSQTPDGPHPILDSAVGTADPEHLSAFLSFITNAHKAKKQHVFTDKAADAARDDATQALLYLQLLALMDILDRMDPQRGPIQRWAVLYPEGRWAKVDAWNGRTAMLIDAVGALLDHRIPTNPFDAAAFPLKDAYTGNLLDLDERNPAPKPRRRA